MIQYDIFLSIPCVKTLNRLNTGDDSCVYKRKRQKIQEVFSTYRF